MSSAPNPPESTPPESTVVVESQIPLHGLGPLDPNSSEAAKTVTASGDKTAERPVASLQATAPPNYEVLSEIGRGGMGVVYKARQRALNRIVALKVVLAGGHASLSQRVRFLAEAEAVAALNHPGIVSVYEFGTWGEQPYMALEYCPGGTLADKLRGTPIPAREATALVERVARAVAAVHERGIIHRDLKPANILFGTDGSPKVGDFGLAKMSQSAGLTVTGAVLGTPSYMAPEQARGQAKSVGPAADIYALGAVLYECFTGRPPFRGASPSDTIVQSLSQEPVAVRALNPAVPVDLETVCLKCLEKDPARRYPSAIAFADDLQRFLDGRPVLARPVGPLGRTRRWVARNQLVSGLLAAVVVTLVAGTTTTYVKYLGEAKERATAVQAVGEKQKALTELEKTLQDLEKLTKAQADTLIQLRKEKAATEDALLRGLLRPLRNQPNPNILHEEARALFELSTLPEERLKFRFIENGLDSQDGFEKITAWPQEVVGAVVGLDRGAALRLRGILAEMLKSPQTSPKARTACALLVGLLPLDDVEVNRLAAKVLAERLTQGAPLPTNELTISFVNLTRRLPEADVASLARTIAERMRLESDLHGLDQLSSALTALIPRLEPGSATEIASFLTRRLIAEPKPELLSALSTSLAAVARRLGAADAEDSARVIERSLTDRIPSEKDSSSILKCSVGLTALTTQLAPEVEQALLSPAVKALATRCKTEKESNPIENLTSGLVVLASRASPADRSLTAKVLAERANSEKDALAVSKFAASLNRLAAHLPPDELAQLVKPLCERLGTETDPSARNYLAAALGEIARHLPPAESASLLHRPVLLFADRVTTEKDIPALSELGYTLRQIERFLDSKDTFILAKTLVDRMVLEKDANGLIALEDTLKEIAPQLTAEQALPLARTLSARVVAEKDMSAIKQLALAYASVSSRIALDDATPLGKPIAEAIVRVMLAERDLSNADPAVQTLSALAYQLPNQEAARLCKTIAARIATEQDPEVLASFALALVTLTGRLSAEEEAALLAAPARQVSTNLVNANLGREFVSVSYGARAISQLAPRLNSNEATAIAKRIIQRMVHERDPAWYYLARGIDGISLKLSPATAAEFSNSLMSRIATEKDPDTIQSLCLMLSTLSLRLTPEDATVIAKGLAQRMIIERDPQTLAPLGGTFRLLAGLLPEAELLALLEKHAAFPPIRTPILVEFGQRAGRTRAAGAVAGPIAPLAILAPPFRTVWEFLDWAAKAHPELN